MNPITINELIQALEKEDQNWQWNLAVSMTLFVTEVLMLPML